jgi:ApbE superfamily uncharacterized protein (UPF0280 family)
MDKEKDYVNRTYRSLQQAGDLHYFNIRVKQSDLAIGVDAKSYSDSLLPLCRKELIRIRGGLEDYIKLQPEFLSSLVPIRLLPGAPEIAVRMEKAAYIAGVGPMAAVAGAISQAMGEVLKNRCQEYMIENGGDIYLQTLRPRNVAVFAGTSPFSYKVGLKIYPEEGPLSICTSSGTVGPSLSFGQADAVVIKASDGALADAVATGAANRVQDESDLIKAIDYVKNIRQATGILAIKNDKMAAWGAIELEALTGRQENESS